MKFGLGHLIEVVILCDILHIACAIDHGMEEFCAVEKGVPMLSGENCPKSSQCLRDFSSLFDVTDVQTGLSIGLLALDASGKDIHRGNTHSLGDYDKCLALSDIVHYCIVSMSLVTESSDYFKFGMCIPPTCNSSQDLKDIIVKLKRDTLDSTEVTQVMCTSEWNCPYSASAKAALVMCVIFLIAAAIGSALDLVAENTGLSRFPYNLLSCFTLFSIFKNIRIIMTTQQPSPTITSLNGIRVMSMFLIILHHVHVWCVDLKPLTNKSILTRDIMPRLWYQVVLNGYFAVDSLFVVSATVASYNTLRALEKRKNTWCCFLFFKHFVHRYLRLTVIYAFIILFQNLVVYLSDGPLSLRLSSGPDSQSYRNCEKYWWTNLLYINNIYPWRLGDECMPWTWSLPNDMQFYVSAPLMLIPLYYSFRMGITIAAIFLTIGFIITAVIVILKDFSAISTLRPFESNGQEQMDYVFSKPYGRIAPYIVGIILGYSLYMRVKLPLSKANSLLCYVTMWCLATIIFSSIIFGLHGTWYGERTSTIENVMFFTFNHFAWGVGVAMVVFACNNGYGWIFNDLFSMKIWTPLSRLTYCVSLVHPIVIDLILGSARQVPTYDSVYLMKYTIAVIFLSYGSAIILATFVEYPVAQIELLAFKHLGIQKEDSVRLMISKIA